ncbi:hypothetical protein [Myxococcus sp. CA056]|uniref:hypothetical protein n=1 Tax=Myxococcus sp. CA056 TaxID=2741740 RepID=UPI0020C6D8B8|nr:hypothetical protein [Myxococcus sp. CA056]
MARKLAMVLTLLLSAGAVAAESLDALSLKVYRGKDGQTLDVVALAPRESSEAVLQVRGADSEHDGLAVRCKVRGTRGGVDYVARHRGADWVLASERESGVYDVFLPGKPAFRVRFNPEATERVSASEVLTAHSLQRESGRLAAFEKKAWPHLEKKYTARAAEALTALRGACGTTATFTFDWKTFSDDVMADVDVWAACAPLLTQARARCAALKDVTALTCRFGPALALDRSGSTLVFTTHREGAADGAAFLGRSLGR